MKPECVLKLKEQLKSEQVAFLGYKAIRDATDDLYLQDALDEIMYDEYLHAKFLRSFLMKMNAYDPAHYPEFENTYKEMMEWD